MAEREGFEPSIRGYRIHTFQACSFNHSDTSPEKDHTVFQYMSVSLAVIAGKPLKIKPDSGAIQIRLGRNYLGSRSVPGAAHRLLFLLVAIQADSVSLQQAKIEQALQHDKGRRGRCTNGRHPPRHLDDANRMGCGAFQPPQ